VLNGSEPCLLPIPLTEEWCSRTKFHVDITENIIIWTDGDKVFMEQYGEGVEEVKNMGYVHLRQKPLPRFDRRRTNYKIRR